jgi:hypothetical protein
MHRRHLLYIPLKQRLDTANKLFSVEVDLLHNSQQACKDVARNVSNSYLSDDTVKPLHAPSPLTVYTSKTAGSYSKKNV